MSFDTLKKQELQSAVDFFGVDVSDGAGVREMRAALVENGIAYEDYQKFLVPDEPETTEIASAPVVDEVEEEKVLVKMSRNNKVFEVYGLRFEREHPFQLVPANLVDRLLDRYEGFRPATPREAQEFYG